MPTHLAARGRSHRVAARTTRRVAAVARALALPALGLGVATACGDPAAPAPPPTATYDLVFDGEVGPARPMLFRVPDGGAPVLVGGGIEGRRPTPHPDGARLVFQSLGDEQESPVLRTLVGTAAVAMDGAPDGLAGEATWSPDGTRLAFLSQAEDPAGDILVARVDGTRLLDVHNLTPRDPRSPLPQPDRTPAWSPDGSRIAFTSYRDGGAAIWVMAPDGSGARAVTAAGPYGDYEPSWSPDGRTLAFQRVDASTVRIGLVPVAGGTPRFLAWPAKAHNPAWSPDGRLAFSSDVDGDTDIFVVTTGGAPLARVRRPGVDRNPAWSRR